MSTESPLHAAGEIVAIGLPFCAFKLLGGVLALGWFAPLGYALVGLAAIDFVLNVVNLIGVIAVRRRVASVCLAELAMATIRDTPRSRELGLAIDLFGSFSIVAIVIALGLLARLPADQLAVWNVAVVLNVLGAGTGRLLGAMRRRG